MSDRHEPQPRAITLGHYAPIATPVFYVALWAMVALLGFSWVENVLVIAAVAVMVIWGRAERRHDATLCPRCARAVPLDGPGRAERRSRWLFVYHLTSTGPGRWGVTIALCVLCLLCSATRGLSYGAAAAACTIVATSQVTHRRLSLWCPWCRDDGDGVRRGARPGPGRREHG